jgi:hypothetical protein
MAIGSLAPGVVLRFAARATAARPRCVRSAPEAVPSPAEGTAASLTTITGCPLCCHSIAVDAAASCPYWEHPSNWSRLAR